MDGIEEGIMMLTDESPIVNPDDVSMDLSIVVNDADVVMG